MRSQTQVIFYTAVRNICASPASKLKVIIQFGLVYSLR